MVKKRSKELLAILIGLLLLILFTMPVIQGGITGMFMYDTSIDDNSNPIKEFIYVVVFVNAVIIFFIFNTEIKQFAASNIVSINKKIRRNFEPKSSMITKIKRSQYELNRYLESLRKRRF